MSMRNISVARTTKGSLAIQGTAFCRLSQVYSQDSSLNVLDGRLGALLHTNHHGR